MEDVKSMDTALKNYIKDKCFDILNQRYIYLDLRKTVMESAAKLDKDSFYIGYLVGKTVELEKSYKVLNAEEHSLNKLCHSLGEEYVDYMNGILDDKDLQ